MYVSKRKVETTEKGKGKKRNAFKIHMCKQSSPSTSERYTSRGLIYDHPIPCAIPSSGFECLGVAWIIGSRS